MSYQLQADEKLPSGVKRIALEQMDEALAYLDASGDDLDKAVHESRKCFKKVRGLLRLVRQEIGEAVFQAENACFRDAGRLLAGLRDSAVMIRTLDSILAEFDETAALDPYENLRESLVDIYQETRQRVVAEEQARLQAAEMVQGARQRVPDWPLADESFTAVAGGLQKIYKRGRNRLAEARVTPTAETLHEWRKRAKYLWYSLRLLQPRWPEQMAALTDDIGGLSEILGDEHDLAQLQALLIPAQTSVDKRPTLFYDERASQTLLSHIERKRTALQTQAFRQGQPIFAASPKAFIEHMQAHWEVAQM